MRSAMSQVIGGRCAEWPSSKLHTHSSVDVEISGRCIGSSAARDYQICGTISAGRTIGSPGLHPNAAANSR